jgi:hypothetical protein
MKPQDDGHSGAGGRNRTDATSLEGWCSTIKLHPLRLKHPLVKRFSAIVKEKFLGKLRFDKVKWFQLGPGCPVNSGCALSYAGRLAPFWVSVGESSEVEASSPVNCFPVRVAMNLFIAGVRTRPRR